MTPVTAFIKWTYTKVSTPSSTGMYLVGYTIGDRAYQDKAMWLNEKQGWKRFKWPVYCWSYEPTLPPRLED